MRISGFLVDFPKRICYTRFCGLLEPRIFFIIWGLLKMKMKKITAILLSVACLVACMTGISPSSLAQTADDGYTYEVCPDGRRTDYPVGFADVTNGQRLCVGTTKTVQG